MTKIGLGIDAGGTATRWCLAAEHDVTLASGTAPPMTGHVYTDDQKEAMSNVMRGIAHAAVVIRRPDAVFAGITGLDADTPAAEFYRDRLAAEFELHASVITVDNDMGLAYRAAFELGTGILVYAGTGSVACHLTADGTHVRAGGRGVIIDDAGSGFWIAREGLKRVLRQEDWVPGAGWTSPMGRAFTAALGGASWDRVRSRVYAGDRGQVAILARQVAQAADAGDTDALGILDMAGRELADLARALLGRCGPRTVALAGGASELHPRLRASFIRALPGVEASHRQLDPARAGAIAARKTTSARP